jgi:signal peptidase II
LEASARAKVSVRALVVLAIVALCVYAIDQITKFLVVKNLVEDEQVQVLGQLLQFRFVKNSGAAFSIGSGSTWIFSIVGVGVLIFVIWYAPKIKSVAWAVLFGLLLGGLLGNLTDRLLREPGFGVGHVVDFIQIPLLPAIFNMADVAIVSSMVLFIILTIRGVGLDGSRHHDGGSGTGSALGDDASTATAGDAAGDGESPASGTPASGNPDGEAPLRPESRSDAA